MITEHDLQEAIAELQGHRNPTSSDCIKLAAYYTILDYIKSDVTDDEIRGASERIMTYSRDEPPNTTIKYDFKDNALQNGLKGKDIDYLCSFVDDLMLAFQVTNPELYNFAVRRMQK